jgi:hypothetical protein
VIQPVLDVWSSLRPECFPNYAAGSWGPAEADELLSRDGRVWRTIEEENVLPEPSRVPATATVGVQ